MSDVVQVTVRDTGKGIAPEFVPYLFQQFQQGERGEAPTSGLGLGLAIARHIVELHRGTIEARSGGPGQGATFIVRLPRERDTARQPIDTRDAIIADARTDLHARSVLILEDVQEDRSLIAHVLQSCGMRVLTADSVQGALAILAAEPVDVIVSAIRVSGASDGLDLIRELRAQTTPAARVSAVAVASGSDLDDRARGLRAGYDLLVAKPIDPGQLIEAVTAVLR